MTHSWVLPQADEEMERGARALGRPSQGSLFVNPSVPANKVFQFQTHNKGTQRDTAEDGVAKSGEEEQEFQ